MLNQSYQTKPDQEVEDIPTLRIIVVYFVLLVAGCSVFGAGIILLFNFITREASAPIHLTACDACFNSVAPFASISGDSTKSIIQYVGLDPCGACMKMMGLNTTC